MCFKTMQKNILWGATYSEMYTFTFFTTSGVHTYVNMDFLVRLQVGKEIQMKII